MLQTSQGALFDAYDVAMLDLDGVVYVGRDAVPRAPEHLAAAQRAGMTLAYVTNNASRPPAAVAEHLRELGLPATDQDVVTSAQAAARLLSEQLPPGSPVFLVGGLGLEVALAERGLRAVQNRDQHPVAVVSGFAGDLRWATVIAGAILVREGLPWVASNTDLTVPTPDGPGPGNGALVEVVARFADREPEVAGKPEPPLFQETLRRVGGERPLVVGDRLDTDIEGARRVGYDSLLVLTGVTGAAELVAAAPQQRPSFVGADLSALGRRHRAPIVAEDGTVTAGPWHARVQHDALAVSDAPGDGDPGAVGDLDTWWQVVAVAGWSHLDATGRVADVAGLRVPGSVASDAAPA
ncbi:MAG: HAD-IIA family hydrolase [Nocardioidaceae bacterium]